MSANITVDQLKQYDKALKNYISEQITDKLKSVQIQLDTLATVSNNLLGNNMNTYSDYNTCSEYNTYNTCSEYTFNYSKMALKNMVNDNSISLMSLSPETITVEEDIQEDYIIYDREIKPNEDKIYKNIVVSGDDRSNRIFFSMYYTFDNRELENKNISVIWLNANNEKGISLCVDKEIKDNNRLTFAWNIPLQATYKAGMITFAIRITEGDNYAWHTLPTQIECVKGLLDEDYGSMDEINLAPSWVAYIENKYGAGNNLIILTEDEYTSLNPPQEDIVYVVKNNDGSVSQYLGAVKISNSDETNTPIKQLELQFDETSKYLQYKYSDETEWINLVKIDSQENTIYVKVERLTTEEYSNLTEIDPETLYLLTD